MGMGSGTAEVPSTLLTTAQVAPMSAISRPKGEIGAGLMPAAMTDEGMVGCFVKTEDEIGMAAWFATGIPARAAVPDQPEPISPRTKERCGDPAAAAPCAISAWSAAPA